MTLGNWFWVLMLLWIVLGGVGAWRLPAERYYLVPAWSIVFLILLILGWAVFQGPLKG